MARICKEEVTGQIWEGRRVTEEAEDSAEPVRPGCQSSGAVNGKALLVAFDTHTTVRCLQPSHRLKSLTQVSIR